VETGRQFFLRRTGAVYDDRQQEGFARRTHSLDLDVYKRQEMLRTDPRLAQLDAVRSIPLLRQIGKAYAQDHVKLEHLI